MSRALTSSMPLLPAFSSFGVTNICGIVLASSAMNGIRRLCRLPALLPLFRPRHFTAATPNLARYTFHPARPFPQIQQCSFSSAVESKVIGMALAQQNVGVVMAPFTLFPQSRLPLRSSMMRCVPAHHYLLAVPRSVMIIIARHLRIVINSFGRCLLTTKTLFVFTLPQAGAGLARKWLPLSMLCPSSTKMSNL